MQKKISNNANVYTGIVFGNQKSIGEYALAHGLNTLAAGGAEHIRMQAGIQVPSDVPKARMQAVENQLRRTAKAAGIKEMDLEGVQNPALSVPMAVVTVSGTCREEERKKQDCSGKSILLTKWIGMEGMLRIVEEKQGELEQRFTPAFLRQMKSFRPQIWATSDVTEEVRSQTMEILHVGEGGILAALWKLAGITGCGLEVDLKKISILQETIEVCEYFRLNPYQLTSAGCMLLVAREEQEALRALEMQGVYAQVIGHLTSDKDKIIRNGEEVRYIDRPAADEIYKILK